MRPAAWRSGTTRGSASRGPASTWSARRPARSRRSCFARDRRWRRSSPARDATRSRRVTGRWSTNTCSRCSEGKRSEADHPDRTHRDARGWARPAGAGGVARSRFAGAGRDPGPDPIESASPGHAKGEAPRRLSRDDPEADAAGHGRHARRRHVHARERGVSWRLVRSGAPALRRVRAALHAQPPHERSARTDPHDPRRSRLRRRAAQDLRARGEPPPRGAPRFRAGPARIRTFALSRRPAPLAFPIRAGRDRARSGAPRRGGDAGARGRGHLRRVAAGAVRAEARRRRDARHGRSARAGGGALPGAPRAIPRLAARDGRARPGAPAPKADAAVTRLARLAFLIALVAIPATASARILVPMDEKQADHLRAYGLTYWALERGMHRE